MWGYGVKIYRDTYGDMIAYEGNFVNGDFHGVGSLNYDNGNYLYGNFRNGEPTGKVLNYNVEDHDWFIIDESERKSIKNEKGFPPPLLDGYKTVMEQCAFDNQPFKDKKFEYDSLRLPNSKNPWKRWERISVVYPEGKLFT